MSFTGFCWVLLGFTGFYWVLLSFTGFYWVLLGFTGFSWIKLNRKANRNRRRRARARNIISRRWKCSGWRRKPKKETDRKIVAIQWFENRKQNVRENGEKQRSQKNEIKINIQILRWTPTGTNPTERNYFLWKKNGLQRARSTIIAKETNSTSSREINRRAATWCQNERGIKQEETETETETQQQLGSAVIG